MNRKIFVSSVFKSGTWLLRDILERLTGLEAWEPENIPAPPDYGDAGIIDFEPGRFFSWHSEINGPVKRVIRDNDAKAIFLVRNIYDLAVSMYFHFANDTDSEIGKSAGQADFFNRFERDEGVAMIISGYPDFVGLGPHLAQIRDMFAFAKEYPVLLMSYERLCLQKETEIRRLMEYLDLPDDPETVAAIVEATDFDKMKKNAEEKGGGSHFRRGAPGGHREILKKYHLHMILGQLASFAPDLLSLAHEQEVHEITRHPEIRLKFARGKTSMAPVDPSLPREMTNQIYENIISRPIPFPCSKEDSVDLVEDIVKWVSPAEKIALLENFQTFLNSDYTDKEVWNAVRTLAEIVQNRSKGDIFAAHNARIMGSRLDEFLTQTKAPAKRRRVVFIAEQPYFVILREAMYLRRNGHRVFLVSLNPISEGLRHLFEAHFDDVIDTGGSIPYMGKLLREIDADIFHVQCGMWNLYLGRLAIENKGRAAVVCELYDITSVYADREVLLANWSVAMVDLDFAMERYIAHHANAVITRFPAKVISDWSARLGATPRHIAMQAYACPEFTAYSDEKLSKKDGVVRLVYGGTIIPINEDHPPELFPESGMPKALRLFLEQGLAVDILHNPHSPVGEDDPAYAPFVSLEKEFPNFRLLNGVPPDEFAQTLAVYDYGMILMDYDKSVVRIGEGQEKGVVATKIFAYMEAGLPVLINAEYEEMARIVTESGLGLAVHSSELDGLAETLARFDYEAAAAKVKRYNEEHGMAKEIHRLIALYDEIRD